MKVALIGNIAGNAYVWSKFLRRNGLDVDLYIGANEWQPDWEDDELSERKWIHHYRQEKPGNEKGALQRAKGIWRRQVRSLPLLDQLRHYDLVHSFTGSLFFSPLALFFYGIWPKRPYIAAATGSDIREAPGQGGLSGLRMRLFFAKARRTLLLNLDMVGLVDQQNLQHAEFFPFMIDTEKYSPKRVVRKYGKEGDLLFFMPSHLDWGERDAGKNRNSTKGNDRFLRAFSRFIEQGGKAHLVLLDRGPDRIPAHQLITQLGIEKQVTFANTMPKQDLIKHYQMADVIVDQFDVGAFGTIGLEAMSCGKPLFIYIKEEAARQCYAELPPVLNAHTEDEIFHQIERIADDVERMKFGQAAREWISKYHDGNMVAQKLIDIYKDVFRRI